MIKLAQCFKFILNTRGGDFVRKSALVTILYLRKVVFENIGHWTAINFENENALAKSNSKKKLFEISRYMFVGLTYLKST